MQNVLWLKLHDSVSSLRHSHLLIILVAVTIDSLVIYGFVAAQIAHRQKQREPNPPTTNRAEVVDGNTTFAFDLYHQLAAEQDGNLIFSPYSISLNMVQLYAGAKGETAEQMADVLHFTLPVEQLHPAFNALDLALERTQDEPLQPTPTMPYVNPAVELTLTIANGLWTQTGFPIEEKYRAALEKNYGTDVNSIDFSGNPYGAQQEISRWVEQNTRGRITDMPAPGTITSQTRLALINAIYFKGEWTEAFDERKTYDGAFHLLDRRDVSVPMMVHNAAYMTCDTQDNYHAVRLPYGQFENAAMLILVPEVDTFNEFQNTLDLALYQDILSSLDNAKKVTLTMPRFVIESKIDLRKTLSAMGMFIPFSESADFTGITSNDGLSIGYAEHKATIAVDELGTEAVGVTASLEMLLGTLGCGDEVIVDRPFIFMIFDRETDAILFMGRVMNPAA